MRSLFNTVADKRIAVLGFAFKKDTNDTRESAAIDVCRALLLEQAELTISDPKVPEDLIRAELAHATGISRADLDKRVRCEPDVYRAAAGAHALAVLTEWDAFRSLDFDRIYAHMVKPAFAFDGRNILPHDAMRAIGFEVHGIGKPFAVTPTAAATRNAPSPPGSLHAV